ncbi:MAG: response regulator [Proteobacteria bacterium]|nr:response regulator [Pseudomonadota bacterium]MBU4010122.1 response regulator [Pseudomonadota bacterium]MBU4036932.1 response regulator [Pseudomonadota bacterium]
MLTKKIEHQISRSNIEPNRPIALLEEKLQAQERITVLVAEDDPPLLTMVKMMLEELGYQVLAANTPSEAIRLAEENASKIRLFLTDVIMPEMSGSDLAKRMKSLYPGMKILFMSGYPASLITHKGLLDKGVNFIQKPFSMKDLAFKVRDAVRKK